MILHSIPWGFVKKHHTRIGKGRDPTDPLKRTPYEVLCDATDLCFSLRGPGWDFTKYNPTLKRMHHDIPEERGPKRTLTFVWKCTKGYALSVSVFEMAWVIMTLVFNDDGSLKDFTGQFYNLSLPFGLQIAVPLSFLAVFGRSLLYPATAYGVMNANYMQYALIGVLIFQQDPDEWGPLFNSPHLATSLSELWGKRWHQAYRYSFSFIGGRLFGRILPLGHVGYVMGTFLLSGLYHDLAMWGNVRMTGLCCHPSIVFVLNGVGVILEEIFTRVTKRRIGGRLGRIWMFLWGFWTLSFLLGEEPCMREMIYNATKVNMMVRPVSFALGV